MFIIVVIFEIFFFVVFVSLVILGKNCGGRLFI